MEKKPFRFGVLSSNAISGQEWMEKAKRVEKLGYSTLLVSDHFVEQISVTPALTAAAISTKKLRVGSIVSCNDFRHPVLLAKEAATIDLLSNGRFELGMGAGWMKNEYDALGIPFDRAGVRISRLEEALQIVHQYFGDEPVNFSGKHYTVKGNGGLDKIPRPIQKPRPPILVGGGGKRLLSIAALYADIIGIAIKTRADGEGPDFTDMAISLKQKIDWIQAAAGERFNEIELNVLAVTAVVSDDAESVAEQWAKRLSAPTEAISDSPYFLFGDEEQIVEKLQSFRERYGLSYFAIREPFFETFAPIVKRLTGK